MPKFNTSVSLYDPTDPDGVRTQFEPGDDVPEWVLDMHNDQDVKATYDHLWASDDDEFEDDEDATDDYGSLSKDQLVELLAERELPVSGNKGDLIARLRAADLEA